MSSWDFNLIPTMIGFGISAGLIIFICTKIICRKDGGPESEIESRIDLEQPAHRTADLEPVLVSAIPTMRYNREASSSIEDNQCSICLEEYEEKNVLRVIPKCGHKFHMACVDVWLKKESTCPVCRFPLHNSSIETAKHVQQ